MVTLKRSEFTVVIAALALLMYTLALSIVSQVASPSITDKTISNQAAIKAVGVGVYQDPALTVPLTEIDWGILEPGEEKNHTAYIRNESNVPVMLVFATENWSSVNASTFVALTWDYDGQLLEVDGFVEVTFTLVVDPAISGVDVFSFNIVIVGSG